MIETSLLRRLQAQILPDQGRPNPNPMSAKLHRFATKIAVRDSFALGLEQFESKKLAKVRTTLQKEKYF